MCIASCNRSSGGSNLIIITINNRDGTEKREKLVKTETSITTQFYQSRRYILCSLFYLIQIQAIINIILQLQIQRQFYETWYLNFHPHNNKDPPINYKINSNLSSYRRPTSSTLWQIKLILGTRSERAHQKVNRQSFFALQNYNGIKEQSQKAAMETQNYIGRKHTRTICRSDFFLSSYGDGEQINGISNRDIQQELPHKAPHIGRR